MNVKLCSSSQEALRVPQKEGFVQEASQQPGSVLSGCLDGYPPFPPYTLEVDNVGVKGVERVVQQLLKIFTSNLKEKVCGVIQLFIGRASMPIYPHTWGAGRLFAPGTPKNSVPILPGVLFHHHFWGKGSLLARPVFSSQASTRARLYRCLPCPRLSGEGKSGKRRVQPLPVTGLTPANLAISIAETSCFPLPFPFPLSAEGTSPLECFVRAWRITVSTWSA